MRFHSRSYHTLLSTPEGRVLSELTLAHICDNNVGAASPYICNCDAPEVACHLIYEGKGISLDTTLQLTRVNLVHLDGSPALTHHYMVDLLRHYDSSVTTECFLSSADRISRSRGVESFNRGISWEPLPHPFSAFRWSP